MKENQGGSETSGKPTVIGLVIVGLSLFLALFHLYTGVFGTLNAMLQRSIHLGVALVLVFLIYPANKGAKLTPGVSNYVFLVLTIVSMGYLYWNSEYLTQERIAAVTPATLTETVLCICLISVVLEGVRRTLGMPLAIVVAVFRESALGGAHEGAGTDIVVVVEEGIDPVRRGRSRFAAVNSNGREDIVGT